MNDIRTKAKLALILIGVGVLYWTLSSSFHALGLEHGTFAEQLLSPDAHHIWERAAAMLLVIALTVYSRVAISRHKRMAEALRESEQKYKTLFEGTLDGVVVVDETLKILLANQAAASIIGFDSVEELLAVNPFDLVPQEEVERVLSILTEDMFDKDLRQVNDFRLINKAGEEIWISAVGTLTEYEGKPAGLGSFRDATERKRMEESLKDSEEKFRSLVNNVRLGIFRSTPGPAGRFLEVNPAMEEIAGYSRKELLRMDVADLYLHPETREAVLEEIASATGKITKELSFRKKDGTEIVCSDVKVPVRDGGGEILYFDGILEDITERKRMEEALRESEQRLRMLFEYAPDAYYLNDLEGNFVDGNRAAEEATGYTKDELIGRNFLELNLLLPEQVPKAAELLAKNAQGQPTGPDEFTFNRKDGNQVPLEIRTFPVEIRGSTLVLGIARDITERRQAERELKEKNRQLDTQNEELQLRAEELTARQQELMEKTEEAAEANRLKSEFLAHMSHELRTPLNVIIGFSELMTDEVPGAINEEQKRCLSDILESGQHLLGLIDDVLDLSRIESGKMEFRRESVALAKVMESLTRSMMPILRPRNQSLDVELEEGLPLVYANEGRLGQVLLNLVDNSSNVTPDGGRLRIEAVRDGDWCLVSVIDNGIGIKKEDQERIFEPFCQLDNPLARRRGGTGVGLVLVKQIIEGYGGRIWVESKYGEGSRFSFTVPLARNGQPGAEDGDVQ